MATAQRIPEVAYQIVLTLNRAEAEALRRICQKVGGDPQTSSRKHIDAIDRALVSACVPDSLGARATTYEGIGFIDFSG